MELTLLLPTLMLDTVSGPVRDLNCNYNILLDQVISCEWKKPDQTYSPIQYYNVNVTHNGKILLQNSVEALKWEAKYNLTHNEIYTVSVGAMTNTEGTVVETRVHFINSSV